MTNRQRNLRLARALFDSQSSIANRIDPDDQSLYDKLERQSQGKTPVTSADAKRYAECLDLPEDWFDRDNDDLLHLSAAEYNMVKAALRIVRSQHGSPSTKTK